MLQKKFVNSNIVTAVILLLLASLAFVAIPNPAINTANAQTTAIPTNLLQYEWTQATGDASRSFASAGPGPNSFNIKWRTQILGVISEPIAFSGKVFVQDNSVYFGTGSTTYCLDAGTGQILYKMTGVVGSIVKLDDNYMLIGNNAYRISDGTLAWKAPTGFMVDLYTFNGLTQLSGIGYDPTLKTFFTGGLLSPGCAAWSLPDASKPPTLLWSRANQPDYGRYGAEQASVESQGIVILSTPLQYLIGVNASTGQTLWATQTKISNWIYGMSVQSGVIGFGGLDGNFYGWNLTTGELMWTYNPGTFYNEFASAVGSSYGMFYEHNQDNYVYAINATTGKLVWRAIGPGIAYSNTLTIAGGKVYVEMGENQYVDFATGLPGHSEFDCYDAYTGAVVWSAPIEDGAPFNSQCNAYGNLYIVPTVSSYHAGTFKYAYALPSGGVTGGDGGIDEVWCISDTPQDWPMAFNDPAHGSFGSGPTNLALTWEVTAGGGIVSSPTLVNGVAYLGAYDGNIYAFNADTGAQVWNYSTDKLGFSSTVAVVNGKLYTGPDDGKVYCLDAETGAELWQASAGAAASTSPTVTGDRVYVGGGDKLLYCFNALNGVVVWTYNATGAIAGAPAVADDAVYITAAVAGGGGPNLIKLNATTGALMYNIDFAGWLGDTSVSASPTLGAGMVFVRANNRYNYAINATTGATIWMVDARYNPGTPEQANGASQSCAMLYEYGRVYFNNFYGISCVNAFNGTELWYTFLSRENLAQGLSYSYGRIYTVNENGVLYVLDALTGQKLSYYAFSGGGAQLHSMPTPYNGSLYVASLNWNLYCFDEYVVPAIVTTNMTLRLSTNQITKGDYVYIDGGVSPINYPVNVTLTLDKPDSTYVDIPVTTDPNGNFMVIYTFDIVGDWKVVAVWNGDDTHTAAYSDSLTLTVVNPVITPPPEYPQPIDNTMTIIGTGIAIIIAIAIAVVIIRRK